MENTERKDDLAVMEQLENLIGKKVAMICSRYHYWGVVDKIINTPKVDFVRLINGVSVEQSGPSNADEPQEIDYIGTVLVAVNLIELIHQAKWVYGELPHTSRPW